MDHPLNEAYRKARKQYTLFAGLLMAWELVGIRLGTPGSDDVNAVSGKVFDLDITILSPEAAPWVLIAILLYLFFRVELEWRFCQDDATAAKFKQWDRWSAHGLAGGALGLYLVQRVLEVQLADIATTSIVFSFSAGYLFPLAVDCWLLFVRERSRGHASAQLPKLVTGAALYFFTMAVVFGDSGLQLIPLGFGLLIGLPLAVLVHRYIER